MPDHNNTLTSEEKSIDILIIGKGVLISYIISIVMITIYGLLLSITSLSEASLPTAIMVITTISIAIAGIYASLKVESKGWLNGALIGLVYMIILMLLGLLFKTGVNIDKYSIFKVFMGFIIGSLSGAIGINLK
ncbi:MAG: TIGR04086 family membrane protein [Clostridiales bacterium]|nr:TIGR04086 family membrane protein [Clostridiales bacterium]HBM81967.1 TIGR04086 family membrane protein [Clostridiaceae bacterium]